MQAQTQMTAPAPAKQAKPKAHKAFALAAKFLAHPTEKPGHPQFECRAYCRWIWADGTHLNASNGKVAIRVEHECAPGWYDKHGNRHDIDPGKFPDMARVIPGNPANSQKYTSRYPVNYTHAARQMIGTEDEPVPVMRLSVADLDFFLAEKLFALLTSLKPAEVDAWTVYENAAAYREPARYETFVKAVTAAAPGFVAVFMPIRR